MKKISLIVIALLLFVSAFSQQVIYKEWSGQGEIIVSWCDQEYLPINIIINSDNTVNGSIGDAIIKNGNCKKRNFIMRLFGNGMYIITGELEGDIVKDENINRKSFKLMFNIKDKKIAGELQTSGKKAGNKETMKLTVRDIVLE